MEVDLLLWQEGEKTWGEEGSERSSLLLLITGAQGWQGQWMRIWYLCPISPQKGNGRAGGGEKCWSPFSSASRSTAVILNDHFWASKVCCVHLLHSTTTVGPAGSHQLTANSGLLHVMNSQSFRTGIHSVSSVKPLLFSKDEFSLVTDFFLLHYSCSLHSALFFLTKTSDSQGRLFLSRPTWSLSKY